MNISVVTATFNSAKTLAATFNSLLNQTNKNFEYIVVDGGSSDNTTDIIKHFEGKFIDRGIAFKWVSERDNGIYDAWNKALKLSSGDWISFLGSDDVYLEDAIELYSNFISKQSKPIDLVYSINKVIASDGSDKRIIQDEWSWPVFRRKMNIGHVGSFHNMNYFKKHGAFNPEYKIAGDYELLLRAGKELKTAKLNAVTVLMGYGGISNKQIFKVFTEAIKAKNETGKLNLILCYFDFLKEYSIYFIKKLL